MSDYLRIEGDPTIWQLDQPVDISQRTGETISLAVKKPLIGTLLLSRRVASVAAFNEPDVDGGVPNDVVIPVSAIYLPTASGPSAESHGYVLASPVDLTGLASKISAAMNASSQLTIELGSGLTAGVLVLNGATLPFVVLCPANAALGTPSGTGAADEDRPGLRRGQEQ
jgi:hypothetical protein